MSYIPPPAHTFGHFSEIIPATHWPRLSDRFTRIPKRTASRIDTVAFKEMLTSLLAVPDEIDPLTMTDEELEAAHNIFVVTNPPFTPGELPHDETDVLNMTEDDLETAHNTFSLTNPPFIPRLLSQTHLADQPHEDSDNKIPELIHSSSDNESDDELPELIHSSSDEDSSDDDTSTWTPRPLTSLPSPTLQKCDSCQSHHSMGISCYKHY